MASKKLKVGDRVRSKAVGSRESFNGVIVEIHTGYYHVRDSDGRVWHRKYAELSRIK